MKQRLLLAALLLLLLPSARGQEPYKVTWGTESVVVGTGIVNAFAASAFDGTTAPLSAEEVSALRREDINSIDRGATYRYSRAADAASDWLIGAVTAAPLLLTADAGLSGSKGGILILYLETMLFSVFTPSYAKGGIQRLRPFVYNPEIPLDVKNSMDPRRSFYSGHTANAFAAAVFLGTVYTDTHAGSSARPYVWAGALGAASLVGYLRYAAGAHYPTDILTGAVAGSIIGYLVPALHKSSSTLHSPRGVKAAAGPRISIYLPL